MKKWYPWMVCGVLGLTIVAGGARAQPANDTCSAPQTVLLNSPAPGTNFDATSDVIQTNCSDLDSFDVWYRFTAPSTAGYTFSTLGSALDTTLSLWTQCAAGIMILCNDDIDPDAGVIQSQINGVSMSAGQVVLVRVAGAVEAEGPFTLRVMPASVVPGSCCQGSTCAVGMMPSECVGLNQRYITSTGMCNAGANTTDPCCHADYNKVSGITVQDVFDFLAGWFSLSSFADIVDNGASVPTLQSIFDFLEAWFDGGC